MKGKIFLSIVLIAGIAAGCSSSKNMTVNQKIYTEESDTILIGRVTRNILSADSLFSDWYLPAYKKYQPDQKIIKSLDLNGLNIEIFFGTWCGDSQEQVPRFMKILDEINFPEKRLTLFAVNHEKKTLHGEDKNKNIQRVPTFIVYKGHTELGRIIEHPDSTLEYDLYKIVNK
jgi:thiol-disulfide isomerase/thioredoxin